MLSASSKSNMVGEAPMWVTKLQDPSVDVGNSKEFQPMNDIIWISAALIRSWDLMIKASIFLYIFNDLSRSNHLINDSIAALAAITTVFIAGWVLFTTFARRESLYILPPRNIRNSWLETMKMMLMCGFAASAGILSNCTVMYLIYRMRIAPDWMLYFSGMMFFIFGLLIFGVLRPIRTKPTLSKDLLDAEVSSVLKAKVLAKINANLNESEKAELVSLVHQSRELAELSVQRLAKYIWNGLFIALLLEILQEIFGRL